MHREGHVGFSLLVLSAIMYLLHKWNLLIAIIALGFSTFPDVDLKLGIAHRKWTHNVFFALASGLAFGWITEKVGLGFGVGFWGAFGGVILHILGDLMTYRSFAPLYPLSKRKTSLKLFRSDNVLINWGMLIAGISIFVFLYGFGRFITWHT